MRRRLLGRVVRAAALAVAATGAGAATVQVNLPLQRTVYQTNEGIDLAVVRKDAQALAAGSLSIDLAGPEGSAVRFAFPVAAVAVAGDGACATEHFRLEGRLLRPGAYTVTVTADGATATTKFELLGHVRQSTFRIIDWGSRAHDAGLVPLGEASLGFNTVLGDFRLGRLANVEAAIRGGLDYMQVCTMSGAHQMDVRMECDWSDPYVLGGGVARAAQQAFISRTTPNCLGVHFYDEPGLTWEGDAGPMGVTAQHRSYRSAFDRDVPAFGKGSPDDPLFRSAWTQWHNWHQGFLEAAWRHSAFAVEHVRADYLPITQSVYGFTAYADGYYFNIVRPLPLISGHGGYSDGQTGFYYPAWHMEYGRMRDLNKPYWYLPSWYLMSSDQYRVEQYLSFINNLQGLAKPPDHQVHEPAKCQDADGILEANKIGLRLGTIFTTMPVTRPPVAVLYSMSQLLDGELRDFAKDPKNTGAWAYEGGGHSRAGSLMTYIASKALHVPFFPVVEEDIVDGTLARHHRVLVVPAVNALEAKVISALEGFIQAGGVVLVSDDSKVEIPGATRIGAPLPLDYYTKAGALWQTDQKQYWIQASAAHHREVLAPFIKALGARLAAAKIGPVFECDNPGVVVARQAAGDIEYLFAVNGNNDKPVNMNQLIATEATIGLPADKRPVYDAVRGGEAAGFKAEGGMLRAKLRLGPGQMRAWARTARPIGGLECLPAVITADYTVTDNPQQVRLEAVLVDTDRRVLAGAAPVEVVVTDPLGAVRWQLYRATAAGVLRVDLPLAANDPAGEWQVTLRDLLAGREAKTTFAFAPAANCGALAGTTARALTFGNYRANIYRFFQLHKDVTIVTGSSDFNQAAAERLTKVLAPWGVRCRTMTAAAAAAPRAVPEEAQRTWCGLDAGRPDFKNPSVGQVGFAVDGPVLLIGNPEDNPLLAFALARGFLPYKPAKDQWPGRGRGYLAWQLDAVGYFNQESVALIAYDAAGLAEAVGTTYEICAGIEPLLPIEAPAVATVNAARNPARAPAAMVTQWRALLPDRVVGVQAGKGSITAVSHDGTVLTLSAKGQVQGTKVMAVAEADDLAKPMAAALDAELAKKIVDPRFIARFTQPLGNGLTAVVYWGGLVRVVGADGTVQAEQSMPNHVTSLAALDGQLLVGLADGQLLCLAAPEQAAR